MQQSSSPAPIDESQEEQQPIDAGSVRQRRSMRERPFTNEVIDFARENLWEVFHIHDQNSRENYRKISSGAGFPDLVMFRTDPSGKASMVVAELKVDEEYSRLRPNQRPWKDAFEQFIPYYEWRPSDWDKIERVIIYGPAEEDSTLIANRHSAAQPEESRLPWYFETIISNLRNDINEQEFSRGDRASLKRMDIERLNSPVFQKLATRRQLAGIGGENSERKWATVVQGIAMLSDYDTGRYVNFGEALFSAGDRERKTAFYSEHRLHQLFAARDQMLRSLMARAFRMLASAEIAIFWPQVAKLVLNDGFNENEADRIRDEIAADYYAAQARAERRANQTTDSGNE